MTKTNAERQRAWRQRRAARVAALETECAELCAERDRLQGDLDAALGEAQRLALTACRHPASAVDGSLCHACGTDLW